MATRNAGSVFLRLNPGQLSIIDVKSSGFGDAFQTVCFSWVKRMSFFFPSPCTVPLLDKCLQNSITPLRGPLWVSKGEGFSPSGAKMYIQGVLLALHQRLKSAKNYCEQVSYPKSLKGCFFSFVIDCTILCISTQK